MHVDVTGYPMELVNQLIFISSRSNFKNPTSVEPRNLNDAFGVFLFVFVSIKFFVKKSTVDRPEGISTSSIYLYLIA